MSILVQLARRREPEVGSGGSSGPTHRRPGLTLYRYVANEALVPSLIALAGLTTVVLTKDLLGFSELVINRGVPARLVVSIAFFKALPVAAQMFPFAVLVGSLVGLGRLGADREILVLEASGVAAPRLVWPIVTFATAMAALSLLMSLLASPFANRHRDALMDQIALEKPWAQIRSGVVNEFGGVRLDAREVSAEGTNFESVLLWIPSLENTIFARSGSVKRNADGAAELALTNGKALLSARGGAKEIRFAEMSTVLPEDKVELRTETEALQGLPLAALADRAEGIGGGSAELTQRASIELHRRFALPIATLVFGFLAVPLFVSRKNFSRAGGGMMGVLSTVAYYGLVQLGDGLIQGGTLSPAAGVWFPNLLFVAVAIALLVRALGAGSLGHAFDRPQRSVRANVRATRGRGKPHRYALPRYVGGRFVSLTVLSFAVIFSAYLLIDVLERLDWFARHGAGGLEIVHFYSARFPLLASRSIPMAILIGSALVVSLLAVEGELIGMRACGIPAPRAMLPVLVISALFTPLYFALNNVLLPYTNALADEIKLTQIRDGAARSDVPDSRRDWFRSGQQVIEAERFDADGGEATDITIYELGDDGLPVNRTDASTARHIGHGEWRLENAARMKVTASVASEVEAPLYMQLGQELSTNVDTMHYSVAELAREADEIEAAGYDASILRTDYHLKLAESLACIVLPAVVMFFAVGGPPFPGPAQTLFVSGIVGVSYILLTGVSASLGHGKAVPPAVGGWSPTLAYAALAGFFGLRLWRRM